MGKTKAINIQIPVELHHQLRMRAATNSRTIKATVVEALEAFLGEVKVPEPEAGPPPVGFPKPEAQPTNGHDSAEHRWAKVFGRNNRPSEAQGEDSAWAKD